jgi:hypothetical protein
MRETPRCHLHRAEEIRRARATSTEAGPARSSRIGISANAATALNSVASVRGSQPAVLDPSGEEAPLTDAEREKGAKFEIGLASEVVQPNGNGTGEASIGRDGDLGAIIELADLDISGAEESIATEKLATHIRRTDEQLLASAKGINAATRRIVRRNTERSRTRSKVARLLAARAGSLHLAVSSG